MCVAHWRGKFGRGRNPDALMQRLYLLTPIPVGFGLMGGLFLLFGLGVPISRVAIATVFGVALVIGWVGLILWFVQPDRVRPAWQKRQQRGNRSRQAVTTAEGHLALEVHARGEPVRTFARYTDVDAAVGAARALLDEDPDAAYVTVFDARANTCVRVVER